MVAYSVHTENVHSVNSIHTTATTVQIYMLGLSFTV